MAKFNKEKIQECADFIEAKGLMDYGGSSLKDFCLSMGIDTKTYRLWMKKDQFREAVEEAKKTFKHNLSLDLAKTLSEAAKGGIHEDEMERTEYTPDANNPNTPRIRKMIKEKTKKYFKPDIGAAIFLLTNLDPEHFQNRQRSEMTIIEEQPLFADGKDD